MRAQYLSAGLACYVLSFSQLLYNTSAVALRLLHYMQITLMLVLDT